MPSPARLHRERILAAALASRAAPGTAGAPPTAGPAASAYEQMLMQLGEDRRRLHDIQSVERKIEAKRAMVPEYAAWLDGAIAGAAETGRAVQDEIVSTLMIWTIDVGDYARALVIARHVLRWRLALPERYKRQPAVLVTEEIAEAALTALGGGAPFPLAVLLDLEDLVADADMPDQVRAKLHKAIGLELARAADIDAETGPDAATRIAGFAASSRAEALRHFRRALELNGSSGVKKNIEVLERALRKDAPGTSNQPGGEATA